MGMESEMTVTYLNKNIQVSKLFCDKLSFTVNYLLKSEHEHIEQTVKSLGSQAVPYRRRPYKRGVKVYQGEYPSQMTMVIQWEAIHSGVSFMRVDFNPSKADTLHVFNILNEVLPGGWSDVLTRAVFTRFDAAIDIQGVLPHQLLAYYPKKTVSQIHCKSGVIETMYLGTAEAANRVVVYDKLLHVTEMNKKFNLKLPKPTGPTTRVEIRMKPDVEADGLAGLENPFENLLLRLNSLLPKEGPELWRTFVALVQFRGAQDALLVLDQLTRDKFRATLKAVPCNWWKPEKLWEEWAALVFETLMLENYSGKNAADGG
jgi:hypothetical protein